MHNKVTKIAFLVVDFVTDSTYDLELHYISNKLNYNTLNINMSLKPY